MTKKIRKYNFIYSNNTDEIEYNIRKNFTEVLREKILKKWFTHSELSTFICLVLILGVFLILKY